MASILGGFSKRVAPTVISAFEYSKFIKIEKRSTFLRIQAENDPKNNSAGFAKLLADSGVIPKVISDCLMSIDALFFEDELALIKYSIKY